MDGMKKILIGISLFVANHVCANEALPNAGRLYKDPDSAAIAVQAGSGGKAEWRRKLNVAIIKDPKNSFALSNRGYLRSMAGDISGSDKDYQRALESADKKSADYRHVLWSCGWAKFNIGEDKAAIDYWQQAERHHGGAPYWVPYTISLSYWRLNEKELALAYYGMAVKSDSAWGSPDTIEQKTRHWNDGEKKIHAELFAEYLKQAGTKQ